MSAALVAAGPVGARAQRLAIHLLVVDDDDVDRERVLRLLRRADWDMHSMQAANGADALRLVREHEFDCVMLDNQLGAATGAELLPALHREALRDCPIIVITGAGNEALAVQALRDGAADHLPKFQLSTDILTRAIQRALEHQQMRQEIDSLKLEAVPEGQREALFDKLVAQAVARGQVLNMAAHLEIDNVIDPAETLGWLARGLRIAARRPLSPRRPFLDTW